MPVYPASTAMPAPARWVLVHWVVVYTATIFITRVVGDKPNTRLVLKISLFLESLAVSIAMPVLTDYLLYLCGEGWRKSRLFRVTLGMWLVYAALLVYAQFSETIYYYDPMDIYHRGPLYPLLLVPPADAIYGVPTAVDCHDTLVPLF